MESGPNVLLAIKCRIENKSWAEFIDWRDRPPRRRPTKMGRTQRGTRMTPENAGSSQPKKMERTQLLVRLVDPSGMCKSAATEHRNHRPQFCGNGFVAQ